MQISQELVRFNRVLTEKINKKVLKTLRVHKPLFSFQRFSLETETSAKFNQVKSRLDKLSQEIKKG